MPFSQRMIMGVNKNFNKQYVIMKTTKLRLATTHLDRHGESFTIEALKNMVEQTNKEIIPLGVEHDPRIPPRGRVIKAELKELEDGEYVAEGIAEMFDGDFSTITDTGERKIPVREYDSGKFNIVVDRNFRDDRSQQDIEDLKQILLEAKSEEEIKKSLDPISILTIGSAFVLGAILEGFLGEIGADAYRALKQKLIDIFNEPPIEGQEKLFTFDTTISNGDKSVNVEIIITNPTVDDIQKFFDDGIKELDQVLPRHFENDPGFARIVFEYKADHLQIKFGILKNGIPVYPE